ncbi:MAG: terminase family protein, partial [Sphaerochaetaceae bacterium]|nr:terminase family protein [Sphaerochaetaceae bacterium]
MTREESKQWVTQQTLYGLSRAHYVASLGFKPFLWQSAVLTSHHKRKHINGSRQSGKSTIVSSVPCHTAKFYPGSLSIILAPTEKQATEDILKVKDFIASDPYFPDIKRDSQDEIALANKSRIIVIPATERSARGYSKPMKIVLDEASRIPDIVYKSGVRPTLTDNPTCELYAISTPNGKSGFFYEASQSARWEHYEIRSPWEVDSRDQMNLIEYMDE